ncbi:hypothetical protein chiPu_0023104 [Chiloscyllium punctatum]|uniref:Uncharacterized protein n=1 Tax=Chiloscyllium punctatum TaxID=137246 RepID=A0A401T8Q3_CHIPU|nr:hypothetical protein [Chiloscyllium punctatum]
MDQLKIKKMKEFTAVSGAVIEAKITTKLKTTKGDGPLDLRVYELNLDGAKSTPSKGSSTDISETWEKEFGLDTTEEEVQLALSHLDVSEQLEDEDEDNWE